MDTQEKIRKLRERTGLNRKEFCEKLQIPYRTVSDWETGLRHAPDYVIRLLEYYICMEELKKKNGAEAAEDEE